MQQLGGEEGADRRLLGWLGDDRVAGGQRGGDLAGENGKREVPGRDAGEDAAAVERQRVALAGRSRQRQRADEQAPRLRRVISQEVDRLAYVALRVVQRLAGLAHDDGHQARLVALVQVGRGGEDLRPLGAAQLVPVVRGLRRPRDRRVGLRRRRDAHRADALAPVVRAGYEAGGIAARRRRATDDGAGLVHVVERVAHLGEQRLPHRRLGQRQAVGGGPLRQVDVARAHERPLRFDGAAAFRLGHLHRVANDLRHRRLVIGEPVDEGRVGAVLEQPAHQIGQQILVAADRGIDAAGPLDEPLLADHLVVQRLAHAMQALELEGGAAAGDMRRGNGIGVVRGELRIERLLIAEQQPHAGQERHVRVQLAREHGIVSECTLLRPLDLAVPVGAFDEAHRNAFAAALSQTPQPAQRRDGALAVRLHGDAEAAPVVHRRIVEGGAEDLQRWVETVLLLRIDGQRQAARAGGARQRQHARSELGCKALVLAGLEARMQGRQLDRQPRAAEQRVGVHGRKRPRRLADGVDRRQVALKVDIGVLLRARRFAEHVVGEQIALRLVLFGALQRVANGAPEHELVAQYLHRLADSLTDDRLAGAGDEALQRVERIGAARLAQLDDAPGEHQRPGRGVDE